MKPETLSEDQIEAVRTIGEQPGPFFLTGPAGTGKSFVIEFLKNNVDNCVVTAMTGAAAQLIGGRTLHSFAGLHPKYGVVRSRRADEAVRDCDLLVIDEISMASVEILEQLDVRFRRARHRPKVLMVGDFLQLPPVEGKKVFDTETWQNCKVLKLSTPHRQGEGEFLDILSQVRMGFVTEDVMKFVESRTVDMLPDDCVHLMARRAPVMKRNMQKLSELPGRPRTSRMEVTLPDPENPNEEPKEPTSQELGRARFAPVLSLKDDARVMLLTNDPMDRWVNGSTGIVSSIEVGSVWVELDSGDEVEVTKADEEVLDGDGKVICTVRQYPIQLAWATTIHKSQGSTIDRVGIDLEGHFETGQTYVAMSRCRTAGGLFLVGKLRKLLVDECALSICS